MAQDEKENRCLEFLDFNWTEKERNQRSVSWMSKENSGDTGE